MKIAGKHAVVTGGASGIGRELCRRFKQLEDSSQISVILRLSMCL